MLGYELLLALIVFFFTQNVSNLREGPRKHPVKAVLVVSGDRVGSGPGILCRRWCIPGFGSPRQPSQTLL